MKKQMQIPIAFYAICAVITFGHAWHRDYSAMTPGGQVVASTACAACWPLYWSTVFWSGNKQ